MNKANPPKRIDDTLPEFSLRDILTPIFRHKRPGPDRLWICFPDFDSLRVAPGGELLRDHHADPGPARQVRSRSNHGAKRGRTNRERDHHRSDHFRNRTPSRAGHASFRGNNLRAGGKGTLVSFGPLSPAGPRTEKSRQSGASCRKLGKSAQDKHGKNLPCDRDKVWRPGRSADSGMRSTESEPGLSCKAPPVAAPARSLRIFHSANGRV